MTEKEKYERWAFLHEMASDSFLTEDEMDEYQILAEYFDY
jgi:hypothetical protein